MFQCIMFRTGGAEVTVRQTNQIHPERRDKSLPTLGAIRRPGCIPASADIPLVQISIHCPDARIDHAGHGPYHRTELLHRNCA